jgi:hypothetical protein
MRQSRKRRGRKAKGTDCFLPEKREGYSVGAVFPELLILE